MKPLVIYHADCTDGYGAAFAAWMKMGDEAEYCPFNYADSSPDYLADLCKGREVYILDFSFRRLVMDHIFKAAKRVVWLDHHKTAFEMWCGEVPPYKTHYETVGDGLIRLDDNRSGALLAWEYFHPGTEVPKLIKHIDDRDRWQFKLEGSKELHAALSSYKPWSFEQWQGFASPFEHEWLFDTGASILRAQDRHVKSMAKQARKCVIIKTEPKPGGEHWEANVLIHEAGLAVNASLHQSEVGHELATTSGTFGLVWYMGADNKVKGSLRSNGDYDVSAIAKAFGGGGHKNAAGFETDITTLMGWLK